MATLLHKKSYMEALKKGLTSVSKTEESAVSVLVSENSEAHNFMMELKKQNILPLQEHLDKISDELDQCSAGLSVLDVHILTLKDQLKKLKEKRHELLVSEMINAMILRISNFLKNGERIDPETLNMIFLSYQPKDESESIDTNDPCYLNAISIYKMILANSQHQEEKNVAYLELALHELRIGNVPKADFVASLILDDSMKHVYNRRKNAGSY
jgi:hypothetical protein